MNILKDLNKEQKKAILHIDGPLLVFAGAGTGKTRVITYKIAYLIKNNIKPDEILGVTFTNKAAEEMKTRVKKLIPDINYREINISTFHSFAANLLRKEAKTIGINPNFTIYSEDEQLTVIKDVLKQLKYHRKYQSGYILNIISRLKDNLLDAESYEIHTISKHLEPQRKDIAQIYKLYQKKLQEADALDFGDLILKAVEMLRNNQQVREKYKNKFRYILIDEYQDTNRAQYVLVKYLLNEKQNICVVGDDDQSIYSWRGAEIRNILEFEKEFPKTKIIKLEQNYRSTQNILRSAYNVISHNKNRKEKRLWTVKDEGEKVKIFGLRDEMEEAKFIITEIQKLSERYKYSDIAVFYRTNAQSRIIENLLRLKKIPYEVVGGIKFYERKEIKDIVSYLKVIANPYDNLSLKRIINSPPRGIGKVAVACLENFSNKTETSLFEALDNLDIIHLSKNSRNALLKFQNLLSDFRHKKNIMSIKDLTQYILDKTGYIENLKIDATYEAEQRIENLNEFINAVVEFESQEQNNSLQDFLNKISLLSEVDTWMQEKNTVTLMTLHLAKGLEFPVVFLTGLEEGLFPIIGGEYDLEEERRLCYVGMTRAKEILYMTYSITRRRLGIVYRNRPSRFIFEAKLTRRYKEIYTPGEKIHHPIFGSGKVLEAEGPSSNPKVLVLFEDGRKRKLALKYIKED